MTSLSDVEILRRVQRGERDLYVELFDRYYERVERYARSRSHEAASGLAADTFQWAYRNMDSFRPGEMSYLAYLLTICRKLALLEEGHRSSVPAHAQKHGIRDALEGLSAEDREALYLAYEPALSRQEVMAILNEPTPDALNARLYRAMQRLDAVVRQAGLLTREGRSTR